MPYTIVYSNTGREEATDVQIAEAYDPYVDVEWAAPAPNPGTLNRWTVPDLLSLDSGTITVVVRVADDTGERTSLVNAVQISANEMVEPVYTAILTNIDSANPGAAFLPIVARDSSTTDYFEGPWEQEPNNSYAQANGPLRGDKAYYGYPNDEWDIFSIDLGAEGTIVVDLTMDSGEGVQLQLRDQGGELLIYDWKSPFHIEYAGAAKGRYYIPIYKASGHNYDWPYTIQATFP